MPSKIGAKHSHADTDYVEFLSKNKAKYAFLVHTLPDTLSAAFAYPFLVYWWLCLYSLLQFASYNSLNHLTQAGSREVMSVYSHPTILKDPGFGVPWSKQEIR